MIIIKRHDGHTLNMSAACSTGPNSRGMIVEMPGNEFYIVPGYNSGQFIEDVRKEEVLRGYSQLVVIEREWEGWPR